jgi:hypothetical protein
VESADNIEYIDFQLSKNDDWNNMKFKEIVQNTYVEGIQLKIVSRFMGGRKRCTPAFVVTKNSQDTHGQEQICIPIPSMGWKKAWKQSLLALSAISGRRHVVRYLNRPPKLKEFIK